MGRTTRGGRNGKGTQAKTDGGERPALRVVPPDASRAKKVEVIRESYEEGRYVVEPRKVAEKMVDDAVREIRERRRRKGDGAP